MSQPSSVETGITHAFATPISYVIHDDLGDLNSRLAEGIWTQAATSVSDDDARAHHGGYYSRGGFFASGIDGSRELGERVQRSIRQYLRQLVSEEYAAQAQFQLQTWVGVTRRGDYQTPHVHPGSTISGVYYVAVPDRPAPEGSIEFVTPVGEQEMSFLRETALSKVSIRPKAGGLLLFPSYLRHYTRPFEGDEDRICVVFNVFLNQKTRFAGTTGDPAP